MREKEITDIVTKENLSIHFFTSAKEDISITEVTYGYEYILLLHISISESFKYVAEEVYKRFIKHQPEIRNGVRSCSRSSMSLTNS